MLARDLCCIKRAAVAAVLLVVATAPAWGVQRSESGAGQYLILPFVLAANGYDTLIEVSNDTDAYQARALKLRLLDRDGELQLTANLYLPRHATWAAALAEVDGQVRLLPRSEACLLIEGEAGVESAPDLDVDFEFGSMEIVEMGVVVDTAFETSVEEGACSDIAALWNDTSWQPDSVLDPPLGALSATTRLINVERGTMYGVPTTALSAFSDIVQHEPPGAATPDLASTHDGGTPSGQTRSVLCGDDGCVEDVWENPIDAASAALMVYRASGSYEIAESLNARSEWLLAFPTQRYYADTAAMSNPLVSLLVADRAGRRKVVPSLIPVPPPPPVPTFLDWTVVLAYSSAVQTLDLATTVADMGSEQPSSVFGIEHVVQSPGERFPELGSEPSDRLPENGQLRLGFGCGSNAALVAQSGRRYYGCPLAIGAYTEYTNGVLPGEGGVPQRANYGASGRVVTTVRIDPPIE